MRLFLLSLAVIAAFLAQVDCKAEPATKAVWENWQEWSFLGKNEEEECFIRKRECTKMKDLKCAGENSEAKCEKIKSEEKHMTTASVKDSEEEYDKHLIVKRRSGKGGKGGNGGLIVYCGQGEAHTVNIDGDNGGGGGNGRRRRKRHGGKGGMKKYYQHK